MQNYIDEHNMTLAPVKTVKPNVAKLFLENIIYVFGIAAVICIILIYLNNAVGLDVFLIPLEMLGIVVDTQNVLVIMMSIYLAFAIVYLVFNYLSNANLKYEFYADRVRMYESTLFVFKTNRDIYFKNIVKISYNYKGFMNKILHSGEIVVDVTGMKEGFVKMVMIDQTEDLVNQLLKIVSDYNALQQMRFQENIKIGNIMRKF